VDEAIKNALETKGYKYVDHPDEASMVVVAHGCTKEKVQLTDWGSYGWYRPWWGPYGGQVEASNYNEGTLVIDVVDMPDKELAWHGLATGIVGHPESNPEKQQAKVNTVVTKILNDFSPP
jgi:hypothetical protein